MFFSKKKNSRPLKNVLVIENDWREKKRNLGDQERARIGRQENKNEAKTNRWLVDECQKKQASPPRRLILPDVCFYTEADLRQG